MLAFALTESRHREYDIHERIPHHRGIPAMTCVIEFHRPRDLPAPGSANHKIQMFLRDLVERFFPFLPAPLRSFVTSRFRKKYSYPILLDWSGDVVKSFAPQSAAPNIYLLSKTGSILHQAHGPLTESALNSFPIPDSAR